LLALFFSAGAAAGQEPARVDVFGDPLPAGAVARLGTIRFRPGGWISHLAFSPAGDLLACCSGNGLTVYDAATGRELRHVPFSFSLEVRALALAWPTESRGVAVLELQHGKYYVWEFTDPNTVPPRVPARTTGISISSAKDHEHYGRFAVSPDGKHLAVGRRGRLKRERFIDLLELVPGKWVHEMQVIRQFGPHPGDCVGLAFVNKNRSIVAFGHERGADVEQLIVYDQTSNEPRRRITVPANDPRTNSNDPFGFFYESARPFAFTPDERTVALGAADGTVRVWDMAVGKEIRTVARHVKDGNLKVTAKGARHLAFGAGGRTLLSAGADSRAHVWEAGTGRHVRELGPNLDAVYARDVSPDGKRFATGGANGQIRLWDAEVGASVYAGADYPDVDWTATGLSPGGRIAASAGTDGGICLWDLADGRKLRRIDRSPGRAASVTYTPDGKALLIGGSRGKMEFFDAVAGKPLPPPGDLRSASGQPAALARDGRTLVTVHRNTVTVWDWPAGRLRRTFQFPDKEFCVNYAHLSPDGRRLIASAWKDQRETVELWDVTTGHSVAHLQFPSYRGLRPVHSPDGNALLLEVANSVYGNPTREGWLTEPELSLWDPERLTRRRYFTVPPLERVDHGLQLGPVAFSLDGRTLALGTGDRPITLFEVATGQVRRQLAGHRDHVMTLAFTPDGRRLLSTSSDRTGLVWDVRLAAGAKPAAGSVDDLWETLADTKAERAFQALARLAAEPDRAVALVRARLKPARVPLDAELDRLVVELDSAQFAVRQKAAAELDRLGDTAVAGMASRLPKARSLELRRRVEQFLDKYDRDLPPPERLREGRALELLESIGTAEARAVLRDLATGSPAMRLTQDAAGSLRRLERKTP
jgi:WD40 repeat protein